MVAGLLAAALVAGCGTQTKSVAPGPRQIENAFRGSPPPLAGLHARANAILPGGLPAFHAELASLHGYPIVINKWASWCGPCTGEAPMFQRAALAFGRRVAFIGLDGPTDARADASKFLAQYPETYPSYFDPNANIARSVQAGYGQPITVYVDRTGKIVFVHPGEYPNAADLERDVKRYALG
jgi:thiol-disulfide isomerase/thioredoxin